MGLRKGGFMRITVRSGRVGQVRGAVQVFAAMEGEQRAARLLPDSTARDQELKRLVAGSGFRGAPNEVLFLPRAGGRQWVLVVGLGKEIGRASCREREEISVG